jgi:hypothetical protein
MRVSCTTKAVAPAIMNAHATFISAPYVQLSLPTTSLTIILNCYTLAHAHTALLNIQPFHFEFRATTKTDLTPAMVLARIGECTGSKSMVGDARAVTPQQGSKSSSVPVSPSAIAAAAAGLSSLSVTANGQSGAGHSDDKQQQQQQLLFEDEAAVRDVSIQQADTAKFLVTHSSEPQHSQS